LRYGEHNEVTINAFREIDDQVLATARELVSKGWKIKTIASNLNVRVTPLARALKTEIDANKQMSRL